MAVLCFAYSYSLPREIRNRPRTYFRTSSTYKRRIHHQPVTSLRLETSFVFTGNCERSLGFKGIKERRDSKSTGSKICARIPKDLHLRVSILFRSRKANWVEQVIRACDCLPVAPRIYAIESTTLCGLTTIGTRPTKIASLGLSCEGSRSGRIFQVGGNFI